MPTDRPLPTSFPVFPLRNAVLFPKAHLPLNIFEPRYINMIDAVLAGPRYLGMVQPRASGAETVGDDDAMYEVGCLARLSSFSETDDGRYLITLSGITRFQIVSERPIENGYRSVNASFDAFASDQLETGEEAFDRDQFLATLRSYMTSLGLEGDTEQLRRTDDRSLISAVAMSAPFTAEEKQALLETAPLAEQAKIMRSIMEIAIYDGDNEPKNAKH